MPEERKFSVKMTNPEKRLQNPIKRIFNPSTIALIGATEREGSVGKTILENLLLSKERKIFPVNPNRDTVLGMECYADVAQVSEEIDLAIIVTPARIVLESRFMMQPSRGLVS